MLIAITIMVMLMALAATTILPATESRRSREAARALNVYLSSARNRAMETGRPCGVILHRFGNLACAMSIDQCEVPPCYCGETEQSAAQVVVAAGLLTANFVSGGAAETLPPNMVRLSDIIQFGCQGPLYSITASNGTVDSNGFLSGTTSVSLGPADISQNPLFPWTTTPSPPVPYRIFRSPIKGAAAPLQLPAPAVVDLQWSGIGIDPAGPVTSLVDSSNTDVCILFSPNGSIERVYSPTLGPAVTQPIFLLIGKRERVTNLPVGAPAPGNRSLWANWQDLDNIWVVVNPQTGLITTDNVAVGGNIAAARLHARDAQGMGGK